MVGNDQVPVFPAQALEAMHIPARAIYEAEQERVTADPALADRHDPAAHEASKSTVRQQQFEDRENDQRREPDNRIERYQRKRNETLQIPEYVTDQLIVCIEYFASGHSSLNGDCGAQCHSRGARHGRSLPGAG